MSEVAMELFNPLGPVADISVMVSHKRMGIYMGGLLLGVILQYMVSKLFPLGPKELIKYRITGVKFSLMLAVNIVPRILNGRKFRA